MFFELVAQEGVNNLLRPGKTVHISFPKLGKTWSNKDSRMGVYLPEDYSQDKRYPLFVWYGGGYGSDSPGFRAGVSE